MNPEQFEKAVGAFLKALKSRSNPADAMTHLGKAYGLLGNEERKLEYLEIARKGCKLVVKGDVIERKRIT